MGQQAAPGGRTTPKRATAVQAQRERFKLVKNLTRPTDAELGRELVDLEKKKMVALAGGVVVLTRTGYLELTRRFPFPPRLPRK